MKQILGFFAVMAMMFPLEAKKSSSKKIDHKDSESYIVIKNHRARGVQVQVQRGIDERKDLVHKKLHHVKNAREAYYKKHKPHDIKKKLKNKKA